MNLTSRQFSQPELPGIAQAIAANPRSPKDIREHTRRRMNARLDERAQRKADEPAPRGTPNAPETEGGNQLGAFYTGHEIKQHWAPLRGDREIVIDEDEAGRASPRLEHEHETWARKGEEAAKAGLTNSVRSRGVLNHVQLGFHTPGGPKPEVLGGHHRIAAAGSQFVPVEHHTDFESATSDFATYSLGRDRSEDQTNSIYHPTSGRAPHPREVADTIKMVQEMQDSNRELKQKFDRQKDPTWDDHAGKPFPATGEIPTASQGRRYHQKQESLRFAAWQNRPMEAR